MIVKGQLLTNKYRHASSAHDCNQMQKGCVRVWVVCVCDVMVKGQLLTNKYRRVSSVGAPDKMQKKVVCVYVCG